MTIKRFYIIIFVTTCFFGCKTENEVIKADLSSVFIGKYSGILAHGDAQYPRLTQDSWEVEVSRLNEDEVSLDVQVQLQQRVDLLSPFVKVGDPDIRNFKIARVTSKKSFTIKETRETNWSGENSKTDISITGRLRDTSLLALEVRYDYLDAKAFRLFTILLTKK